MTTRPTPAALLALVLTLLPAGCSIGNQHFYGLEPTDQAPIDRVVYRLARPEEQQGYGSFAWAEQPFLRTHEESGNSDTSLEELLADGDLHVLLRTPEGVSISRSTDLDTWVSLPNHRALIRVSSFGGGTFPSLLESDQLYITYPSSYDIANFRSGRLRLAGDRTCSFQVIDTSPFEDIQNRTAAWIRLVERRDIEDPVPAGGPATVSSSLVLPEFSFRPSDADFALHAIAPTLNPDDQQRRIVPGMPLSLLANRLYLGRVGELLGDMAILSPLDSGEIAVVVSVTEAGEEQPPFLAFYHDQVARRTFVPSWGSVLYSTESWSGDPLSIKLQVFDLDGVENAFFDTLLGMATEAVAQITPEARAITGIAGAIGDLLIKQNSDNEIMRFEFTFVHDTGSNGATRDVLTPYERSYIVLRPDRTNKFLEPERIQVDDQWRVATAPTRERLEGTAPIGIDKLDSYFTFTISSSVQIPAALMQRRQQVFRDMVESGQIQRLPTAERLEVAQQAARELISGVEFLVLFQDLKSALAHRDEQELLSLARRLAEEEGRESQDPAPTVVAADRTSLLKTLKQSRRGRFSGLSTWAEIVEALEQQTEASAPVTPVPPTPPADDGLTEA